MTRMSKQARVRAISPRRPRPPGQKTGAKKDNLKFGYRVHDNTLVAEVAPNRFIPKIG